MPDDTDPNQQPERTLLRWRPPSSTQELPRMPGAGRAQPAEAAADQAPAVAPAGDDAPTRERGGDQTAFAQTLDLRESGGSGLSLADGEIVPAGTLVGERYVVERHISSGSFGAVYKASDRLIDNHAVALKLLHSRTASDSAEDAALRELRLIASVAHPSVVQFKDYGWLDGRLWFAMPWYEGETLQARLTGPDGERLSLTRAQARPIFERLAYGLAAMHSVGVNHHDIKPENIFLSRVAGFGEGLPVLLDLGIAAERGELPTGFTAEYTAPETAARALGEDRGPLGEGADVFALALTLRTALDPSTVPSAEGYSVSLLHLRANTPVDPPAGRDLRYLGTYFKRWLALDPLQRPSAVEFAAQLEVLTAPEERRIARARVLRRVVPLALAAAVAVSVLGVQLRRQSAVLVAQRERLSEQMQQTQELRQRSAQTLAELEDQVQVVGQKDRQLGQAIEVARKLDDKLEQSVRQRETLTRSLRTAEERHTAVSATLATTQIEYQRLEQERDAIRAQRDGLGREREALIQEREQLSEEGDLLRGQVHELRTDRAREAAATDARIAQLEAQMSALRRSLQDVEQAREALRIERDKLSQDKRGLERELERGRVRRRVPADGEGSGAPTAGSPGQPTAQQPTGVVAPTPRPPASP